MEKIIIEDEDLGRRRFLTAGFVTFGVAGMATVGMTAAPAMAQENRGGRRASGVPTGEVQPISDAVDPADLVDPVAPEGLHPNASLDQRWPVNYRRSVPQAFRVMVQHFDAIATRSYPALRRTMHFPFGLIEGIDSVVVNRPEDLSDTGAPYSLNFAPNGSRTSGTPSRMIPGAYDIMKNLQVLNFDSIRVNMAMTFDRHNRHGIRTARCEGIYCVTNNNGKWGITLMSTIWTPDDLIGRKWPDAEEASFRIRANRVDSYDNDVDIISRHRPNRGQRLGVRGGSGTAFQDARSDGVASIDGRMEGARVRGVTDRLTVQPSIGEPPNPDVPALATDRANRDQAGPGGSGGPGNEKWRSETRSWSQIGITNWGEARMNPEGRIVHASSDKVHRFSGAARYNIAGEFLNTSMEVTATVLGSGAEWTDFCHLAYITVHDRTQDIFTQGLAPPPAPQG